MKPLSPDTALQRAAARCASQECCLSEIRSLLVRWGIDPNATEKILLRLEREGYIDESRYARAFVHDRVLYQRWGRLKIGAALRQKRISEGDIRVALSEIKETDYLAGLRHILTAKRRTLVGQEPRKIREKLARFALSRGFEAGLVFDHVEQCVDEDAEESNISKNTNKNDVVLS